MSVIITQTQFFWCHICFGPRNWTRSEPTNFFLPKFFQPIFLLALLAALQITEDFLLEKNCESSVYYFFFCPLHVMMSDTCLFSFHDVEITSIFSPNDWIACVVEEQKSVYV